MTLSLSLPVDPETEPEDINVAGHGDMIAAKPEDIADEEQDGIADDRRGGKKTGIVAAGVDGIAEIETGGNVEGNPLGMASTSMIVSLKMKSVFFPFGSSFVRPSVTFVAEVSSTSGVVTPGVSVEVLASLTD